jgi:diguanylate cyclase (GGDEF)-like protein
MRAWRPPGLDALARALQAGALLLLLLLLLLLGLAPASAATAPQPLVIDDARPRIEAWPAVTVLSDPGLAMDLAQVQAARHRFALPTTARHALGQRRDAVWLHLPLQVAATSDGRWVLDLEYAALQHVDLYLTDPHSQAVLLAARSGALRPPTERAMPARTHAVTLPVAPGGRYELWIRVQTSGGMIVPLLLSKPETHLRDALREQMLQGLVVGLGLCLLLYSLAQWVTLREPLLIKYALLISGCLLFQVVQFGIGYQFLWGDLPWVEAHAGGLAALMASGGMFLFVDEALKSPQQPPWFGRAMKGSAALLAVVGLAFAFDLVDLTLVSAMAGGFGLLPALLGTKGALRLARSGDSVGWIFIVAWVGYLASTAVLMLVVKGHLAAGFTSLHAFQFGTMLDMVLFLRVLALRLNAIHHQAERVARERDTALSMAQTDPLTGLLNRRGLREAIDRALPSAGPSRVLALFMIDLDGFKAVNDQHGHEVGDELLVVLAARLRASLPPGAVAARLGGDEFVLLLPDLPDEAKAQQLGEHLAAALREPLPVRGLRLQVGASVGCALAPRDGQDASALLKQADAAMYAGKQGRRR